MTTISAAKTMSDFSGFIDKEKAGPIFEKAAQMSAIMQLCPQVPLGLSGTDVPVFTGEVEAGWVSEGNTKPKTEGGMALKTLTPKKLAAIHVVSQEVVRANPGGYVDLMRVKIAEAFAKSFDAAAFHGKDLATGGAGPFATSIADTTKSVELGGRPTDEGGVYADIIDGLQEITDEDKELTGFALSPRIEPRMLLAVDTSGRPIFQDLPATEGSPRVSRLIGRPAYFSKAVHQADSTVEAIGGDWTQAAWGVIGGISYAVSTEASVTINGTLSSVWEKNLVAIRLEAEYGFVVNDADAFVQYLNNSGS